MSAIDEYIAAQDEAVQPLLYKVCATIREVLPDAEERISWGMPTWKRQHNIIHFAAAKKHVGIYPGPDAVEHFVPQLDRHGLKYSKGAIQFPYNKPFPQDLLREIAKWCGEYERRL